MGLECMMYNSQRIKNKKKQEEKRMKNGCFKLKVYLNLLICPPMKGPTCTWKGNHCETFLHLEEQPPEEQSAKPQIPNAPGGRMTT